MEVFFTKENCCRSMYDTSVESNQNCIAILKPEVLGEELRSKDNQLVLLLSGFGCRPVSSGNVCYVKFCANGFRTRIERYDLLGIADEETENYAYKLMNPFTEEEAKFLIPIIEKDYKMFDELDQNFKDDSTSYLKEKWHTILAKLSTFTYQPYSKVEYANIIGALASSDLTKQKQQEIKEKKIDLNTDPECIFINKLYNKLHKLMEKAHE